MATPLPIGGIGDADGYMRRESMTQSLTLKEGRTSPERANRSEGIESLAGFGHAGRAPVGNARRAPVGNARMAPMEQELPPITGGLYSGGAPSGLPSAQ
jgi:hypothetical protein